MYHYLKDISCNFNDSAIEYVISDIRNYAYLIRFTDIAEANIGKDESTGYLMYNTNECWIDYTIKTLNDSFNSEKKSVKRIGYYLHNRTNKFEVTSERSDLDNFTPINFESYLSLRDRIKTVAENIANIQFQVGISQLMIFSDIAEKEYKRITGITTPSKKEIKPEQIKEKQNIDNKIEESAKFSALTPNEFCNLLYSLFEDRNRCYDATDAVTENQMSQYIKSITNNYDKSSFEFLLSEIRNFAYKIKIKIPKTEAEIANNDLSDDAGEKYDFIKRESKKYHLYKTDFETLCFDLNFFDDLKEKVTLREKIRAIKKGIPNAIFYPGLTFLLTFSEIAEKQFEKRTATEHYNSNDLVEEKQITVVTSARDKDIITNKKYLNLTPSDFCTFLYKPRNGLEEKEYFDSDYFTRKNEEISEHILFQYIKHNTSNFDKKSFDYLIADIRNYVYQLTFHLPEIYQDGTDYYSGFDFEQDYWGNIYPTEDYYFSVIFNQPEFTIETIANWDGVADSMYTMRYHIPDNLTFKEGYELIMDKIPLATFRYGIDDLLHFSEFAEDEYAKITETTESNESENYTPTIQTIWNNTEELKLAHKKFNKLLKCDLNTWLYWFGGIPLNNPKQIKWIFKDGNKRALSYFIERISKDHNIEYSKTRKIFDIQIKNKDKYQSSFSEIDDLLK